MSTRKSSADREKRDPLASVASIKALASHASITFIFTLCYIKTSHGLIRTLIRRSHPLRALVSVAKPSSRLRST